MITHLITLSRGRIVRFKARGYTYNANLIHGDGGCHVSMGDNGALFRFLRLSEDEKYKLASNVYGYNVETGIWPYAKTTEDAVKLFKYAIEQLLERGETIEWK